MRKTHTLATPAFPKPRLETQKLRVYWVAVRELNSSYIGETLFFTM